MTTDLVECVPNFSEGRDKEIIDSITSVMTEIEGIRLLDVDMGADFNRTVVTIVGPSSSIVEAALAGTKVAMESIDMSNHSGEHARMGAIDVVPFIPIRGVTMDDCVSLAEEYAKRAAAELDLGVYLYAKAAKKPERVRLPDIRRGEYEALEDKLENPSNAPDYGPSKFNPKSGVTASGARPVLIAYNVNLSTADKSPANKIAGAIRTSGVLLKDKDGNKIVDEDGKPMRKPGKFQSLQAAGWMYDEDTAQVSMNLLDFQSTGLYEVTEEISRLANELSLKVTAGELVGLIPEAALVEAGLSYDPNSSDPVTTAIRELKLDILDEFDPEARIIERAAGE